MDQLGGIRRRLRFALARTRRYVPRTVVRAARKLAPRREPGAASIAPYDEVGRLVVVAQQDADLMSGLTDHSMLSPGETAVLHWLVRLCAPQRAAIAELGTYLGGTTRVFGEAMQRSGVVGPIEVYDFFEHNAASRTRLRSHPLFDEHDFYDIWRSNTDDLAGLIELHRGDLRVTAREADRPLWMVYVDIVKAGSLIDPVMHDLLPRLEPGGFLIHQDYYHWQSPWVVYATEHVIEHFEICGTVSNHMMVLRLNEPIPFEEVAMDFEQLAWGEKDRLFERAIARHPGIREALLRVSRLNLMSVEGRPLPQTEVRYIRERFANASRVQRYLDEVIRLDGGASADRKIW